MWIQPTRPLLMALALGALACSEDTAGPDGAKADAGGGGTTASSEAGSDGTVDGQGSIDPSIPCQATAPLSGGFACAIAPGSTLAGITDSPEPGSGSEYHAVAIPDGSGPSTAVLVFFAGTGGIPFNPGVGAFGGNILRMMQQGVDHGFIVLVPAYARVRGGDIYNACLPDPLCYEPYRREMLEGVPRDPSDPDSIVPPNDITSRVEALAAYLAMAAPGRFPVALDWANVRVGGSSQGAGHACFLGKLLHAVGRVCMFAGPGDDDIPLQQPDAGAGTPAPWLLNAVWETPRERFRGVIHQEDPYFRKTTTAWTALGLEEGRDWQVLTAPLGSRDGHGYVGSDAADATAARAWACFE